MSRALSPGEIIDLEIETGFPADRLVTLCAIALAESGGISDNDNLHEPNGTQSYGLWQINSSHGYSRQQMHDPRANAQAALQVLTTQGLRAWGTYTNGAYRPYLSAASAALALKQGGGQGSGPPSIDTSIAPYQQPADNVYTFPESYTPDNTENQGMAGIALGVAIAGLVAAFAAKRVL